MEYILKKSSNNELINNSNLDVFSKRILSTYPLEIIDDYLNYQYIEPQFENIDEIIAKINAFMNDNKKIVIVGDYDCDGILGTSILVKGFAKLGYHVGYYIPDRLKDGYGLNRNMVTLFKNKGYDLIITIDNGINAHEAITYAIDNHIDVIVSDHHHFNEYDLLANVLYLHPQLSDLDYNISGGMVAYYLVSHLLKYNDDYLKSLASITLLSDVMPIIKNNRLMIKELLHNSNPYLPIKLLSQNKISTDEFNKVIIPKINALGRLANIINPNKLVQYFCTNNISSLTKFAEEINNCNNIRKKLSNEYFAKYQNIEIKDNLIMIEDNTIHEGIIGLLASRLVNTYNCVVIVATLNNNIYKGSVRSPEHINIYEVINNYQDLFITMGGHAQAMGISYEKDNATIIKSSLEKALIKYQDLPKVYEVIEIEACNLTLENVKNLHKLAPFGHKFEKPNFLIKEAKIINIITFKSLIHHKIIIDFQSSIFELLLFNESHLDFNINNEYDFIIDIGINEFRENEAIQSIIIAYQLSTLGF